MNSTIVLAIPTISLTSWKFEEVSIYITITLFVLAVVLLKIAYHKISYFESYIPESLLLILVGLVFGAIVHYAPNLSPVASNLRLTPTLFFNVLLPPIILESAYSLYNKTFGELLGSILLFAVLGTVLNFLLIGGGLLAVDLSIGLGKPHLGLSIKEYLLFASLIVAVDPVAVLAIFQDIGVDLGLYYLVFGESLLNDAVTVVLYNIMSAFVAVEVIGWTQIAIGIGSFFTVSLGGALIGLIHGILSCLLTRMYISSETIVPLLMSYLSYLVADMVGWSGIIAIICCGVFQAAYTFHNLTPISVMLLKSALKQIASISEAIIFLLIGSEVCAVRLQWHSGFVLTAAVMCLFSRTVVVFTLLSVVNRGRARHSKIHWTELVICSYGGLRGAVAFSLAILLNSHFLGERGELARDVLVTTTLAVILFTVAFMGTTMKPLVRLLKIRLATESSQKLFVTLNESVLDQTLYCVEKLTSSPSYYRIRETFYYLDDKFIRPFLQHNAITHDKKIVEVYQKMALKMHSDAISSRNVLEGTEEEPGEIEAMNGYENNEESLGKRIGNNMGMSHHVQKRVKLVDMLIRDDSDLYFPRSTLHARANVAQFARYNHNQANLARAMVGEKRRRRHRFRRFSFDGEDRGHQRTKHGWPTIAHSKTIQNATDSPFLLTTQSLRHDQPGPRLNLEL